ncbi:MAG: NTP transferase domain-containing protein [bacterium]
MNSENINSVGALILAAGSSDRMGTLKPFLRYDNNHLFIEKIIDSYLAIGCCHIVITIDYKNKKWLSIKNEFKEVDSVLFIHNSHPEYERFYSVQIGLLEMSDVNYCFVQNADNPFITKTVLTTLLSRRKGNAYVVPNYLKKGGHPILLGNEVMNHVLSVDNVNSNLKEVLKECQRIDCSVNDASVLININTPEDYKKYFGYTYD